MGSGKHLKAAQNKYGIENFEKLLIQYCYSKKETDKAEKFWIAEYRSRGKAEYNIADGGQGGGIKGHSTSEETRKKISEKLKGKQRTEQQRINIAESHKGQVPWNKGKKGCISDETRKKMSEARKGKVPGNKGKPCSEEKKMKISIANKGRHHTEEVKRKMSETRKRKHWKLVDGKRVWY